ncbi:hypothetical protein BH10BAC3_BH10BAC3_36090 [soil metagenome]
MLLPVGVILGLVTVAALFFALSNIAMLFSVFLTGATVIYIFSSFVFLQKGIDKQITSKRFLKELIKVNAFVSLFFSILGLMQGIMILLNPAATQILIDNMKAMQPDTPQPVDAAKLMQVMKVVLYFMIVLSSLLLFHIGSTFRYLKQYPDLFTKE